MNPQSSQAQPSQAQPDAAAQDRATIIRTGYIAYDKQDATMNCTVMDLSERGARLRPDDPLKVPDSFSLFLRDLDALPCQVTWRAGLFVGVRFSDLAGDRVPTE